MIRQQTTSRQPLRHHEFNLSSAAAEVRCGSTVVTAGGRVARPLRPLRPSEARREACTALQDRTGVDREQLFAHRPHHRQAEAA
ncbi:hypothetical protein, partial [Streptomyces sp. NPDC047968]|uniref:hypothetical protein n=1 Tax=Streptomyces sp. NPDC047968 TaxID=3155382 RepID=UPI00341E0A60